MFPNCILFVLVHVASCPSVSMSLNPSVLRRERSRSNFGLFLDELKLTFSPQSRHHHHNDCSCPFTNHPTKRTPWRYSTQIDNDGVQVVWHIPKPSKLLFWVLRFWNGGVWYGLWRAVAKISMGHWVGDKQLIHSWWLRIWLRPWVWHEQCVSNSTKVYLFV